MPKGEIHVKRVYEAPKKEDGHRLLVDRLWPRGLSKEKLTMSDWLKNVAPSDELRQWFGHDPEKWEEFQKRYFAELEKKESAWKPILKALEISNVTLLYAAKDINQNNAVALKNYLESKRDG